MASTQVGTLEPTTQRGRPTPSAPTLDMSAVAWNTAAPTGGGTTPGPDRAAPPDLGPLAKQLLAEDRAVEALGEQLKQANEDLAAMQAAADTAWRAWQGAQERAERARSLADSAAVDAYKHGVSLGPFGSYASRIYKLSLVAPGMPDQPGGGGAFHEVVQAEAAERVALAAYQDVDQLTRNLMTQRDTLKTNYDRRSALLTELRKRNAAQLPTIEAQFEAYQWRLGGAGLSMVAADGSVANPRALSAVRFALAQLGKRYVWGAEGPDTYDCSGLVWAAYRSVGTTLPRVARGQFRATTPIKATRNRRGDLLLPGDLLFFATNPNDWNTIHHVGIYKGGGLMIHAPHTGDVVKISPIWWSEFFVASRVFPPVPSKKSASPPSKPAPKPTVKPTVKPTPSPSAKPTVSPSASPTAPGTTTPPTSTSPPPPATTTTSSPPPSTPSDPPTSYSAGQSPSLSSSPPNSATSSGSTAATSDSPGTG